ncbi:uncharacterized protein LOC114184939 isoform X2 [Vigna unguiculata]|uniref:uncharacterized protein LOC114184939 isoform X2 n=1 Tax=Vigna unguiculata TaxID=3917 RepID=UPI001016E28E|nr:uncharacterized protein LOC114184939 isoform X2 [Vigna unguiculata]
MVDSRVEVMQQFRNPRFNLDMVNSFPLSCNFNLAHILHWPSPEKAHPIFPCYRSSYHAIPSIGFPSHCLPLFITRKTPHAYLHQVKNTPQLSSLPSHRSSFDFDCHPTSSIFSLWSGLDSMQELILGSKNVVYLTQVDFKLNIGSDLCDVAYIYRIVS